MSTTLTLKKKKTAITEGDVRGQIKDTSSAPEPTKPPPAPKPKEKPYKLQYKGKAGTAVEKSHNEWKHLDSYSTLALARSYGKARMNGNSLHRMFDYRVVDKEGKEYTV